MEGYGGNERRGKQKDGQQLPQPQSEKEPTEGGPVHRDSGESQLFTTTGARRNGGGEAPTSRRETNRERDTIYPQRPEGLTEVERGRPLPYRNRKGENPFQSKDLVKAPKSRHAGSRSTTKELQGRRRMEVQRNRPIRSGRLRGTGRPRPTRIGNHAMRPHQGAKSVITHPGEYRSRSTTSWSTEAGG